MSTDTHLPWLLDGDPAIRWQTRATCPDEPPPAYEPAAPASQPRARGARLLALQDPAGTWAKALYSPKWTSTTYTLCCYVTWACHRKTPKGGGVANCC